MATAPALSLSSSPSTLSRTAYNNHAQTYLDWTTARPSSRVPYLTRLLSLLTSDPPSRIRIRTSNPPPPRALMSDTLPTTTSPAPSPAHDFSILELGCGAGVPGTLHLSRSRLVQHITAVDISAAQLNLLRSKLAEDATETDNDHGIDTTRPVDKVKIIEADMLDLTFNNGTFDAVVALFSIVHLARREQKVMLERVYDWLGGGGYLLANFVGQEVEDGGLVDGTWLGTETDPAYWDGFGPEKTREVLTECGFEVLVADVVDEVDDSRFLWVIARKPFD